MSDKIESDLRRRASLATAVEDSYLVFGSYSIGERLHVCNCSVCMDVTIESDLVATPLRMIPSMMLAGYTNSAFTWDNDVATEMRYFLPRYLDLIAAGDAPDHTTPEECLRRLGQANWRELWPAAEVEVLDRFFDAYIELAACATNDPMVSERRWVDRAFSDALLLAVSAGADPDRIMDAWWRADDPAAALHLAYQRVEWDHEFPADHSSLQVLRAAVDRRRLATARLAELLAEPRVDERLRQAAEHVNDEPSRLILVAAISP